MTALRAIIREHRQLAIVLLVLALFLKAAVPAGFMVSASDHVLTVSICSDSSGKSMQMVIPAKPGALEDAADKSGSCAFSALADQALGGADANLLALAFAVILILGLAPIRPTPRARLAHLRPPLRGPPAAA